MNLDAITVAALRDELNQALVGGRVQHVHLPDELGLAIEIYAQGQSRWLYCSAHPQHARTYLLTQRPPRTSDAVSPLLLLARKYVDGARLEAVDQPPLERMLRLQFVKRTHDGEPWRTELVVELMGRLANLILLDEHGVILDAAKRITPEVNRYRTVRPQEEYVVPPVQDKLDPRTLQGPALANAAADHPAEARARDVLIAEVAACSPMLAREVLWRAHEALDLTAGEADWAAVADALRGLWEVAAAGLWQPTLAYKDDRLVAFAPYRIQSFQDVRPAPGISAALEAWFGRPAPKAGVDEARKAPLRQALNSAVDRVRARLYSLNQSLVDEEEVSHLRRAGEHLLAFGADVKPGQTELRLPGDKRTVALDPQLSAVENARRLFGRYDKLKAAARDVPAMVESAKNEMRYLEEALNHLELADSADELNQLRTEWAEQGYVSAASLKKANPAGSSRGGKVKQRPAPPRLTGVQRVSYGGFDVLVGRSGKGNDALLNREAHPADVWLHARGIPGAHVLIHNTGRDVPTAVLRHAASLAAGQSQARGAGSVAVDYTLRKYVDRIKGAPPGLVHYRGERTLHVPPQPLPARS